MADKSKIEWTDATWNPITGCSIVSPGCINCYAMGLTGGRLRNHPSRVGLTRETKAGPVWNGKVRFNNQWLEQPLHWRKPRRVFVCAHSDLFHENVPDDWIVSVFAVMEAAPQHQFQVLTKRPNRMWPFMKAAGPFVRTARINMLGSRAGASLAWPPPNVWLGVSIEDRMRGEYRALELAKALAVKHFWSLEPLLEDLGDLTRFCLFDTIDGTKRAIDWVIVGGESGKRARRFKADWARAIRDQCAEAGVAFFMKQVGANSDLPGITGKGDNPAEWPADLRIRQFPDG